MTEESSKTLIELARLIASVTAEGVKSGILSEKDELYASWIPEDFGYDESGLTNTTRRMEQYNKKTWNSASFAVIRTIPNTDPYKNAAKILAATFGEAAPALSLDIFVRKITMSYLPPRSFDESEAADLAAKLISGLRGEPQLYHAEAILDGVVLQPDQIEVAEGVTLRRTKREDIQKEYSVDNFAMAQRPVFERPTAVLIVESQAQNAGDIQQQVFRAISILKLFKVGSVKYYSIQLGTNSLVDIFARGALMSGDSLASFDKYLIADTEVERLRIFWGNLTGLIPTALYWPGGVEDSIAIAYKRYNDALFQNGLIERRIANAIGGIEGMLVKPGEIQELTYRLSLRAGKVLTQLGYEPLKVKQTVVDAYKIRNIFAHGGQLASEDRKKYDEKYGDTKKLFLTTMDYLRACILIFISLGMNREKFIDLIDMSLIDPSSEKSLTTALSSAKTLFFPG